MNRDYRHPLLTGLLALLLTVTLAVKDGPWHDHEQHAADCALCHLQSSTDAYSSGVATPVPAGPPAGSAIPLPPAPRIAHAAPYQGRAPPPSSLMS